MRTLLLFFALFFLKHRETECSRATKNDERKKRLISGDELESHAYYDTGYYVQMRQSFGCSIDLAHEYKNYVHCPTSPGCGGSLVNKYFILTACQCMRWWKYRTIPHNPQPLPAEEEFDYDRLYFDPPLNKRKKRGIHSGPLTDALELPKYYGRPYAYHPLYQRMLIIGGLPIRAALANRQTDQIQIRHSSGFFPHSRCTMDPSDDLENGYLYLDYGLVRACVAFDFSKSHVRAINLPALANHVSFYMEAIRRRMVCLTLGFGTDTRFTSKLTDALHYSFRLMRPGYSDCATVKEPDCSFGLVTFGKDHSFVTPEDIGSPIICDHFQVGVVSTALFRRMHKNDSVTVGFTTACAREGLSETQLEQVRQWHKEYVPFLNSWPYGTSPYNVSWLNWQQWYRWNQWEIDYFEYDVEDQPIHPRKQWEKDWPAELAGRREYVKWRKNSYKSAPFVGFHEPPKWMDIDYFVPKQALEKIAMVTPEPPDET